jgi:hypothetical protein
MQGTDSYPQPRQAWMPPTFWELPFQVHHSYLPQPPGDRIVVNSIFRLSTLGDRVIRNVPGWGSFGFACACACDVSMGMAGWLDEWMDGCIGKPDEARDRAKAAMGI